MSANCTSNAEPIDDGTWYRGLMTLCASSGLPWPRWWYCPIAGSHFMAGGDSGTGPGTFTRWCAYCSLVSTDLHG